MQLGAPGRFGSQGPGRGGTQLRFSSRLSGRVASEAEQADSSVAMPLNGPTQ